MKKFLAIILTFALCFGVLSVAIAAEDEAVTAVPDGYIGIYSAEELDNIRNNLSGKYILLNNIDLSSYENWNPIGTSETPFTGELDGNGYVIENLRINTECNDTGTYDSGLFGYVNGASISDIIIKNSDINIKYVGNAESKCRFGNIVGFSLNTTLTGCVVSGNVNIEGFSSAEIGSIAGRSKTSQLVFCGNYSNIDVTISSSATQINVGGISGSAASTEKKCFNYGNISVNGTDINDTCTVRIGGIDGNGSENMGIANSYNRGELSVGFSAKNVYIGGIAGESYVIKNSYNSGNINIPENFSGYAGAVSGNLASDVISIGDGSSLSNSYYLNSELIPAYNADSKPESFNEYPFENVKHLTSEEMKCQELFVGFNFDTVWKMEENGYPILKNMPIIPKEKEDPSTEESTTMPVATPVEPSTTAPSTEESTTLPAATPIEPSTTQPTTATTEPVTEPTTAEIVTTVKPTEPVTNSVTEPSTAVAVTTQPATEIEPTTNPIVEPSTAPSVTEIEPSTTNLTEPSAATTTEPTTEPDNDIGVLAWLIKVLKTIVDFIVKIFVIIGC
ncbi:MAG: hypothetical protein IKW12_02675 [Clostridia bacterium]|nr:hypothetical protein [Clostridia bacterium]